jgi:hypothetical protein
MESSLKEAVNSELPSASGDRRTILDISVLPGDHSHHPFVTYGYPWDNLHRYFFSLVPAWSGYIAIEFTDCTPIAFVKESHVELGKISLDKLTRTSHKNLINLKEAFLMRKSAFFVYASGGIPLSKIQEQISRFSPRIALGELEVATICTEVKGP